MKRWVVKAGSNMVCTGGPLLLRAWMQDVLQLRKKHQIEVIWVTSGAIATARERLKESEQSSKELSEKQALSAIGQPLVMDAYNLALQSVQLLGSQVLLTYHDIEDPIRHKNLKNTLEKLLEWKVVPILNENDAVATEEIKFGDNDSLSARVAKMMKADQLIILTDVEGLYEEDPRQNPSAKLISHLHGVDESILKKVSSAPTSSRGTGGMHSKLLAAEEAFKCGIPTYLIKGDLPFALIQVAEGKEIGTRIQ